MAASFTWVDSANSTGGVATIAGATGGEAINFYVALVQNGNYPPTWALAATGAGNGPITVTLSPGIYYAYATGATSGVIAPLVIAASRSSDSLHELELNAIQAAIQVLTLNGLTTPPGNITTDRVLKFQSLTEQIILALTTLPCVVVSSEFPDMYKGGTNARDDIGHPCLVTIIARISPQDTTQYRTIRKWKEQISRWIRNQLLLAVPQVYTVTVEDQGQHWLGQTYDIYTSSLLFRAMDRDPRGV